MKFIAPEEVGNILARVVIADEEFAKILLQHTEKAGDRMLADDLANLTQWVKLMRTFDVYLK